MEPIEVFNGYIAEVARACSRMSPRLAGSIGRANDVSLRAAAMCRTSGRRREGLKRTIARPVWLTVSKNSSVQATGWSQSTMTIEGASLATAAAGVSPRSANTGVYPCRSMRSPSRAAIISSRATMRTLCTTCNSFALGEGVKASGNRRNSWT
jgi:hypothetical protein